jgi:hypothetical protein
MHPQASAAHVEQRTLVQVHTNGACYLVTREDDIDLNMDVPSIDLMAMH